MFEAWWVFAVPSLPLSEQGSGTVPAGVCLGWGSLSFGIGIAGKKAAHCLY